jgi:hypothetical protein
MTTGDEPQLGGQSDNLSPMISSVQTRVIVSARGAYTVGNLPALIEMMNDQQRLEFQLVTIRPVYTYIWANILQRRPAEPQLPILYELAHRVEGWLQQTTHADFPLLQNSLTAIESASQTEEEKQLYYVLRRVADMPLDLSTEGVLDAPFMNLIEDFVSLPYFTSLSGWQVIDQWRLDLAWSILTASAQPGDPIIEGDRIRLTHVDLRTLYERGNLAVLTYMMTYEQMTAFRAIILPVMLEHIGRISFPESLQPAVGTWLVTFSRWLQEFNQPTAQQYYDFTVAMNRLRGGSDYLQKAIWTAGRSLRLLSGDGDLFIENCSYGADSIALASGYASAANAQVEPDTVAERVTNHLKKWHLEVAWAILNDAPIPPLEESDSGYKLVSA